MRLNGLATGRERGYRGLLNLDIQPHWTVFLTDFPLSPGDRRLVEAHLAQTPTRLWFGRIDAGVKATLGRLRSAGVDRHQDYVSFQGIVRGHDHLLRLHQLVEMFPAHDLARIELPLPECGFKRSFATHLLGVVMRANYAEQDRIANTFFDFLAAAEPYQVRVETGEGELEIRDSKPWFEIAGRLQSGEFRILPGGEVAYTGDNIDGQFRVDGAIVPFPQDGCLAQDAQFIQRLSREVSEKPIGLEVQNGEVVALHGSGHSPKAISKLMERDERYRRVTEVGISFNRACDRFIHDWPAASNETRPGVHMAIGGDTSPDEYVDGGPLLHIDLMAANCAAFVNDRTFLRASS